MNGSDGAKYDVRSVANLVLRQAAEIGEEVSNLHLNKTLYFLHADHLLEFGSPLMKGKIEAWKYGPVYKEIYHQFKKYGNGPIRTFASRVGFESGQLEEANDPLSQEKRLFVQRAASQYLLVPPFVLVEQSHATGGAWDYVWNHSGEVNVGMEITDGLILEREVMRNKRIRSQ